MGARPSELHAQFAHELAQLGTDCDVWRGSARLDESCILRRGYLVEMTGVRHLTEVNGMELTVSSPVLVRK